METQIASEMTLSLIPSLVKMSPLSVPDLTLLRLLTVSGISLFGADLNALYSLPITEWVYPTIITIAHIVSSYLGFKLVPNIWAQILFYTYPFFILIGSYMILKKPIRIFDIIWFIPLMFFIHLLYVDTQQSQQELKRQASAFDWMVGISALLVSSLTEAAYFLYFLVYPMVGSWNRLGISYIGAAILYTLYYLVTRQFEKHTQNEKKPRNWLFAMLWNTIVAGFGYWGRFYSINKVEPLLFSAISYIGLITGHIFAVLFGLDILTKTDIISIMGVLFSILGLTFTPYVLNAPSIL